jgi:lysophospholipase L1-like esterase
MFPPEHITSKDIVFLGDSLTETFDLQKYFGKDNLRNRGMSGNMTEHVLYRLEEIFKAKPAILFLMIGINDIYQGVKPEFVIGNISRILTELQENTPQTVIYCQSILPVNESRLLSFENINSKVYQVNNSLREFCKENNIQFIDIHPDFLNHQGQMDEIYTYDGVHLTEQGYRYWSELIRDYIT